MTNKELQEILIKHRMWLNEEEGGERANLRGANLEGANLEGADLYGANLIRTNLYGTNLRGADLYGANLEGANLYRADLIRADLIRTNLRGANLEGANLRGTNLYGANLRGANLRGADLYGADLEGANLTFVQGVTALYGGQHLALLYLNNTKIKIGCKHFTIQKWINNYQTIGKQENYTEEQIKIYGSFIKMAGLLNE